MKNYPKFSLDTEVVVERRLPNPSYKGLVKKIMVHEIGFYYYIESEYEEPLWVIEDRLTLAPAYHDDLDSWDAT